MSEQTGTARAEMYYQEALAQARISWDEKQKKALGNVSLSSEIPAGETLGVTILAPDNGYEEYVRLEEAGLLNGKTLEEILSKFGQGSVSDIEEAEPVTRTTQPLVGIDQNPIRHNAVIIEQGEDSKI